MQEKIPVCICIYVKYVINITGRKVRAAWKLLASILKEYQKRKDQFVTIEEFSEFTGNDKDSIRPFLSL